MGLAEGGGEQNGQYEFIRICDCVVVARALYILWTDRKLTTTRRRSVIGYGTPRHNGRVVRGDSACLTETPVAHKRSLRLR